MGLGNIDNKPFVPFLQPNLTLPKIGNSKADNAGTDKNSSSKDAVNNITREVKEEKVFTDGTQTYTDNEESEIHTESEVNRHEHGDEGGQGSGQETGDHHGGSSKEDGDNKDKYNEKVSKKLQMLIIKKLILVLLNLRLKKI